MEVTSPQHTSVEMNRVLARWRRYWEALLCLTLAVWLALELRDSARTLLALFTPVMSWDYWREVINLPEYQAHHWQVLWRQHNEHRIVFPEMVFAADALLFHMRQVLPVVLSCVFYAATFAAMSWRVWRDMHLGTWQRTAIVLLAGLPVFWQGCTLALVVPFLLQWPMMQCAVAVAFLCLTYVAERRGPVALGLLIAAATVATYSSGNGLILWPMLIGLALALRVPRRPMMAMVMAGCLDVGLYFAGYHSTGETHMDKLFREPGRVLAFSATYLSVPFGWLDQPVPQVFGFGLLLMVSVASVWIVLRRWQRQPAVLMLLPVIAFALFTAMLTAAGRMTDDPQYGAALAARYLTMPQMTWGALFLLLLWLAARSGPRWYWPALALAIWFNLHYLQRLQVAMPAQSNRQKEIQLAQAGLESSVMDQDVIERVVFPDVKEVAQWLEMLRANGLNMYRHGATQWLGKPIAQYGPMKVPLPGRIAHAYPGRDGILVTGWADDTDLRKQYRSVFLTDEHGIVRGYGVRFLQGAPPTVQTGDLPRLMTWAGYVPASFGGKRLKAFAVDQRSKALLPIGGAFRVPNASVLAPGPYAPLTPELTWQPTPADLVNGGLLPSKPQRAPARRPYGTWQGSDALQGEWQSGSFSRPANGCVVIPVLTGPRVESVTATLEDADTGRVLEQLPLRNDQTGWTYWRVTVEAPVSRLRIHIADAGAGWGEWLAASDPLACPK